MTGRKYILPEIQALRAHNQPLHFKPKRFRKHTGYVYEADNELALKSGPALNEVDILRIRELQGKDKR